MICRLIPMVEPRYNLVELAPKGPKEFVFENMSRYVAVRQEQFQRQFCSLMTPQDPRTYHTL